MDKPFSFIISQAKVKGKTSTYDRIARKEVEDIIELLKACGCDIRMTWPEKRSTASVEVLSMPTLEQVDRRLNRSGGRYKSFLSVVNPTEGLSANATVGEFIEWYKVHTAEEGQHALGLSPATFFRRLKDIKRAAEKNPDIPLTRII